MPSVEALAQLASRAQELRSAVAGGTITEGPVEIHKRLLDARKAQDQLEELVAGLARSHAQANMAVEVGKSEVEDAEAHLSGKPREDFLTGKEVSSRYALATMDQRIALRKAVRSRDEVAEVLEYCRLLYRGVDGTRRDLELRVRLISLASMLEK